MIISGLAGGLGATLAAAGFAAGLAAGFAAGRSGRPRAGRRRRRRGSPAARRASGKRVRCSHGESPSVGAWRLWFSASVRGDRALPSVTAAAGTASRRRARRSGRSAGRAGEEALRRGVGQRRAGVARAHQQAPEVAVAGPVVQDPGVADRRPVGGLRRSEDRDRLVDLVGRRARRRRRWSGSGSGGCSTCGCSRARARPGAPPRRRRPCRSAR